MVSGTSSSPKSPHLRKKKPIPEEQLTAQGRRIVEALGFNPSLPWAIFDELGSLRLLNPRMQKLLGGKIRVPLPPDQAQALWPFQNENESSLAHFKRVVMSPFGDAPLRSSLAVAHLKNFRIFVKESHLGRSPGYVPRLVVAEMVRTGDLLTDAGSRQELFRSLSHEIRTSVMALKGYLDILDQKAKTPELKQVVGRLNPSLERLDNVVERLKDFRVELEKEPEPKKGRKT